MLKKLLTQRWLRHILVAVGYALGCVLIRTVSFSHWSLFAGLQLAALLLTPYEYWAALALGEMAPLAYVAILCAHQYGMAWAALKCVPSMVLVIPIVFACRKRMQVLDRKAKTYNMAVLVLCAWIAAVVVAVYDTMLLSLAPLPPDLPPLYELGLRYGIGHYLGILTVTPLILAAHESIRGSSLRILKNRVAESRLLLDSAGLLLPSLGVLVWIGLNAPSPDVRYMAQVAMFLPMVALALRHGWQGAAIGGSAASIAIVILMPAQYDQSTMQAQTFIAFAITTMLLAGTQVSAWTRREQREKQDARFALALAQRNYYAGERQLRRAGYALLEVQTAGYRVLHRLMQLSPYEFETHDRRTRPVIQRAARLIEHMIPFSGVDRSLPQALLKGGLAQVLEQYKVPVHVRYYGHVGRFGYEFHLAIYRLICDSVVQLADRLYLAEISVSMRCRKHLGQRWIVLHVRGKAGGGMPVLRERNELLCHLRQFGRGDDFQTIKDGAATFGGTARQRVRGEWLCISALLREPLEIT